MLKTGDKVKFLNAVGGGTVTGFVNPKMVKVEDEQGFEVPFLITELVKDERYTGDMVPTSAGTQKPVRQEDPRPKKESVPLFASSAGKPASAQPAWFLAFVPQVPSMPLSGEIRAWLVNDSKYTVLYHFSLNSDAKYHSEKSGRLGPYSRIPLKGFTHADFGDFPAFGFQILPFENKGNSLMTALVKTVKVNPVKFYKETSYTGNAYFETRAMLMEIKEEDLSAELQRLKDHDFHAVADEIEQPAVKVASSRKKESTDVKEVDLHINELVENAEGMEPKELLEIQLNRFRFEMESAIQDGTKRIVFIHGVGQGTLKNELRRELSSRYKKYDFQDASFREYGYGATMVILRRK